MASDDWGLFVCKRGFPCPLEMAENLLVSNVDELIPLLDASEVQRAQMNAQVSYSLHFALVIES
jgi:hypothetical protein